MRGVFGREGDCLLERMNRVTMGISARAVALGLLGVLGGCRENARISPEPPRPSKARSAPAPSASERAQPVKVAPAPPRRPAASQGRGRFALATPDAGSGSIELVIADRPIACGPYQPFPETCEPAWRIRIDLEPAYQRPGEYLLGEELRPFSYRDAQGKNGGVWEPGVECKNLGGHFDGVLEITSVEQNAITGTLTGAGEADGAFRAERCPSCNGVRMSCTRDADCCLSDCSNGHCQP